MIKCYFDGKMKDCNISDCNTCKIVESSKIGDCEFKIDGVCECSDCWQFGEECDTTATKCYFLHHWFLSHNKL